MHPELPRLGELAQTGAEGEEVVAGYAGGEVGEGEADVVDARVVEAEDVPVCGRRGGGGRGRVDEVG